MNVIEYIRKKNELLHKHTGLTLVPEDQIADCPVNKLSTFDDEEACPYCLAYNKQYKDNCAGCPMQLAENGCRLGLNPNSDNSTYNLIADHMSISSVHAAWCEELSDLIDEFNKSNNL